MEADFYKAYIEWFESQVIYREYVSKFPEPFCNPAFASALALVAILFLLVSMWEHLRNWRIRKRIKRKNRELELKQLEMRMREEEQRKRVAEMEEYMRFMMLAQMQNMTSLMGLSFEQWRYHRFGVDGTVREVAGCQTIETEAETADVVEMEVLKKETVPECEASVSEMMEDPEDKTPTNEILGKETDLQEIPEDVSDEIIFVAEEEELPELPISFVEQAEELEAEEEVDFCTLEQCELPIEPIASGDLTEEQQSDFAKLIAMMQAQEKQKEQIGVYNRQRSEITRANMEVLDKSLRAEQKLGKQKQGVKAEESLDKRKRAALKALEAEQQKGETKVSGEKRKLFSGHKEKRM